MKRTYITSRLPTITGGTGQAEPVYMPVYITRYAGNEEFTLKVEVLQTTSGAGGSHADDFLTELGNVMHSMATGGYTAQDVEKGLRIVGDMEAYFTHWRHEGKLTKELT